MSMEDIFRAMELRREGGSLDDLNESSDGAEEFELVVCDSCRSIQSTLHEEEGVCEVCDSSDLSEKVVRVVRDGKVVKRKVPTRKRRMSAAQKAALAKARKKAHSASAQRSRRRSNAIRARKINEGGDDLLVIECPDCGYEMEVPPTAGAEIECPECGADIEVEYDD